MIEYPILLPILIILHLCLGAVSGVIFWLKTDRRVGDLVKCIALGTALGLFSFAYVITGVVRDWINASKSGAWFAQQFYKICNYKLPK